MSWNYTPTFATAHIQTYFYHLMVTLPSLETKIMFGLFATERGPGLKWVHFYGSNFLSLLPPLPPHNFAQFPLTIIFVAKKKTDDSDHMLA